MTGVVQLYMDTLIKRVSLANRTTAAISMLRTNLQQLYQFTAVLHTSLSSQGARATLPVLGS